jgi:hypothetical protein
MKKATPLLLAVFLAMSTLLVITSVSAVRVVDIDIKPGSFPNSINLGSKGVVAVAVLTIDDFDATTVGSFVQLANAEPVRIAIEDVDGDGDIDLVLFFKIQQLELDPSSIEAELIGETQDGEIFFGSDSVNIVPKD